MGVVFFLVIKLLHHGVLLTGLDSDDYVIRHIQYLLFKQNKKLLTQLFGHLIC